MAPSRATVLAAHHLRRLRALLLVALAVVIVCCTHAVDAAEGDIRIVNGESCAEDRDFDGTVDCADGCPDDFHKQAPGVCGCGEVDVDTDSDGTLDCDDECPTEAFKQEAGLCGCMIFDVDSDSDGFADCVDPCWDDPAKQFALDCGCNNAELDEDSDGITDCIDACPTDNPNDPDGDGICQSVDPCPLDKYNDFDGDGLCDSDDPCPLDNPDDGDSDGSCDSDDACPYDNPDDTDGDGICDSDDPCPFLVDIDTDSDGVCDEVDICPLDATDDEDGDGMCPSDGDECPLDGDKFDPQECGCGVTEDAQDDDGDGTINCFDGCPLEAELTAEGECGCEVCSGPNVAAAVSLSILFALIGAMIFAAWYKRERIKEKWEEYQDEQAALKAAEAEKADTEMQSVGGSGDTLTAAQMTKQDLEAREAAELGGMAPVMPIMVSGGLGGDCRDASVTEVEYIKTDADIAAEQDIFDGQLVETVYNEDAGGSVDVDDDMARHMYRMSLNLSAGASAVPQFGKENGKFKDL